ALRRTKRSTRLGRGRAWFGIVAGALSIIAFSIAAVAVATRSSTEHPLAASQPPAFHEPTPTAPNVPNIQVTTGVNNIVDSVYTPLFEIRSTGSQTSPPLTLSTTKLIGAVENDGPVTVWIVGRGQQPHASTHPYYRNGAGDGGAFTRLAAPGQYVVV